MTDRIIEKLKVLLPEADTAVLEIVAEVSVQGILNYTHRDTLPEELVPAAVMICKAYYEQGGFDGSGADITSVKRGDVQTNFGSSKAAVSFSADGGFFGYCEMLNPFRVLRSNYSKRHG